MVSNAVLHIVLGKIIQSVKLLTFKRNVAAVDGKGRRALCAQNYFGNFFVVPRADGGSHSQRNLNVFRGLRCVKSPCNRLSRARFASAEVAYVGNKRTVLFTGGGKLVLV